MNGESTKSFQSGKKSLGFMRPNTFILQMEILKPRKRNLIFPRDIQSLGAEDRISSLCLDFQMPSEIGTLVREGRWSTQGKRNHSGLCLYSPGI